MIDDPLLYLLVDRLNALRRPGGGSEDSDLEHQHLDHLMAARAPDDTRWRDHVLDVYAGLDRSDLADVPARTHHWFIEQLANGSGIERARPGFFADLYDLLDAVGRFLTVRALARSEGVGWNELEHFVGRLGKTNDAIRGRRTREFADLLLDVWLSEEPAQREREGRESDGRSIPGWFRRTIGAAQIDPAVWEHIRIALRERAGMLDQRTARDLTAMAEEPYRRPS